MSSKNFAANEPGTVTTDCVVLTAAIVGLGLAVVLVLSNGFEDASSDIGVAMEEMDPNLDPFADETPLADDEILTLLATRPDHRSAIHRA